MNDLISPLTDWLNLHPHLIVITIAAMAFVESLAMIGVIVPGVALLFTTATLAGGLQISLWECLAAAMLGAIAGDLGSFFLGRYAHGPALRHWPFRQHPGWVERGERFFRRYGIYSVIIGRFVGPVRPVLPFVAGMLSMPPLRFVLVNILSALAWAPVYIIPGYLIGESAQASAAALNWDQQEIIVTAVSALSIFGLLLLWLAHRQLQPQTPSGDGPLQRWLYRHRLSPSWFLTLCLCATALLVLTLLVSRSELLRPLDQAISAFLFGIRSADSDRFFILLTLAGDGICILLISVISWIRLWLRGDRRAAAHWLAALLALIIINQAMKFGLALPRPQLLLNPPSSFSFPSAHTSNSALFLLMLSGFIARDLSWQRRWWLHGPALLAAMMMGVSRIYLGVHWFSDVVAAILLAATVTAAAQLLCGRERMATPALRPDPISAGWALGLLATIGLYLWWKYPAALLHYQSLTAG